MEKMMHIVWGEYPTGSARNAIQGYVSKLRRLLTSASGANIETSPQGYAIRVDKEQVDLYRFRRLTESARNADAVNASALLEEALELWQGPPFTHRSQRRADALKVFHDTRHHLVRELGVEPGDLLRGTHERILRDPVEAPAGG
jgi:DNA-binding SARP family transcriptional activator